MNDGHPFEALQDLVEGRLDTAARGAVEAHVRSCARCQGEIAALTASRQAVRRLQPIDPPAELSARITALLREPVDASTIPARPPRSFNAWWPLAAAAAGVVLIVWLFRPEAGFPREAADAHSQYRAGQLTLDERSAEAETLQRYFATRIGFPTRVFDLGMMGFELVGARVATIGDRTAALWVYRGSGVWLLCQMYRGELDELPPPSETRENNGFVFRIYHERGGTQVFWQEGDVVCVLASDAPAETVIQLAFAKAMKP
jgi:anti-sigma factor RsiW